MNIKNKFIKLPLFLAITGILAALALGFVNEATKDKIAKNQQKALEENYYRVFETAGLRSEVEKGVLVEIDLTAASLVDIVESKNIKEGKIAKKTSGEIIGYAIVAGARGFKAEIKVMVAFNPAGLVIGYATVAVGDDVGYGTKLENNISEAFMYAYLTADTAAEEAVIYNNLKRELKATGSLTGAITASKNIKDFMSQYLGG